MTRRLAAIAVAEIFSYSRGMEVDEAGTSKKHCPLAVADSASQQD
jgi:hypothetical protein